MDHEPDDRDPHDPSHDHLVLPDRGAPADPGPLTVDDDDPSHDTEDVDEDRSLDG